MTRPVRPGLRPIRRALRGLPVLTLAAFLAACASDAPQDTFQAEGKYATDINNLMVPVWILAGLVFVFVLVGCLALVLRFRARDDEHYDEMPPQIHGHNTLEIGWTIAPALILAVIGVFSVAAIFNLNEDPPHDAVTVQVVGQQWWWEYRYDLDGDGKFGERGTNEVVTANDLVIPAGEVVRLSITSRDVIHSFWAPRLNGKRDAVPNRSHPWNLQADQPGEYLGQCTEYCGLSHAEMRIKVIALTRPEFDRWLERQRPKARPYAEDDTSQEAEGYRVFTGQLCSSCHLIEGVNDENFSDRDLPRFERQIVGGKGTIKDPDLQVSRHAPNLTHLMSRTTFAGAKFDLIRDTEYCENLGVNWARTEKNRERCLDRGALEAWLRDPPAEKAMMAEGDPPRSMPRGMPNLELTEEQIDQLVAYLSTLE